MPVALLESSKVSERVGTLPGSEDAHGEDVLASHVGVEVVVGAVARLVVVVHPVSALAVLGRHQIDVGIRFAALYVPMVGAVKREGAKFAGERVRGCARLRGVHSGSFLLWAGLRGVSSTRGAVYVYGHILAPIYNFVNTFSWPMYYQQDILEWCMMPS